MGRSYKRDGRGRFAGGSNGSGSSAVHKGVGGGKRSATRNAHRDAAFAKVVAKTMPKKGAPVQDMEKVLANMIRRQSVTKSRASLSPGLKLVK